MMMMMTTYDDVNGDTTSLLVPVVTIISYRIFYIITFEIVKLIKLINLDDFSSTHFIIYTYM